MGLFSKKEKPRCPICGNEMGFLSSVEVADGQICEACEAMIRGQFDIEEYYKRRFLATGMSRGDFKLETMDPLPEMTVEQIREMINEKKEQSAAIVEELGGEFSNMARVEKSIYIAPKALDVGMKRAKEMKNKIMATCLMVSGQLAKDDMVTVKAKAGDFQARIIDVIVCSNATTFETELNANSGKHKADAGVSAWIIIDTDEELANGDVIGY